MVERLRLADDAEVDLFLSGARYRQREDQNMLQLHDDIGRWVDGINQIITESPRVAVLELDRSDLRGCRAQTIAQYIRNEMGGSETVRVKMTFFDSNGDELRGYWDTKNFSKVHFLVGKTTKE